MSDTFIITQLYIHSDHHHDIDEFECTDIGYAYKANDCSELFYKHELGKAFWHEVGGVFLIRSAFIKGPNSFEKSIYEMNELLSGERLKMKHKINQLECNLERLQVKYYESLIEE